jgi:hypothetical protein
MDDGTLDLVPSGYRPLLRKLLLEAEATLRGGARIPSVYFLGNTLSGAVESVPILTGSIQEKERSAESARYVADFVHADFVVTLSEAWALPPSKLARAQEILNKYGSISAYPGKQDIAWLNLETLTGGFSASAPILPVPPSKKRRRLGPVTWVRTDSAEGVLSGVLRNASVH